MWMQECQISMEDGGEWTTVIDQRDIATWEASDFWTDRGWAMRTRYVAWAASKRRGETKLSWGQFSKECVEVGDPKTVELDPTQRERKGADT